MRKPSPQRLGLLKLLTDCGGEAYLAGLHSTKLEEYGLSYWDMLTVTMAERAGLISQQNGIATLTDEGREMVERYS